MSKPHGGKLIDRLVKNKEIALDQAKEMQPIIMKNDIVKDIENIANGVLSPLQGFMVKDDFLNVLEEKRLANDLPWTIPIVLDVSQEELKEIKEERVRVEYVDLKFGDEAIIKVRTSN